MDPSLRGPFFTSLQYPKFLLTVKVLSMCSVHRKYSIIWFLVSAAEKAMAPHSSTVAWKIPWTEEPGGLRSVGSLRVGHDWETSLSLSTFMHWRRKWQPTPVFLPGEFHGRRSLVGCSPWGRRVGHDWSDLAAAAAVSAAVSSIFGALWP